MFLMAVGVASWSNLYIECTQAGHYISMENPGKSYVRKTENLVN